MQEYNGKELDSCFYEDDEIQRIMFGDRLVWENVKYIDLGTAQTFDIKNYTDNWANLTADNFFIVGNSNNAYISGSDNTNDYVIWILDGYTKSYNASTGILTYNVWIYNGRHERWGYGNVHAVLIEKPEKLISLGTGTYFNVKNNPKYQDFTYKNFLMLRPNLTQGVGNQIAGVRAPINWNASAKVRASYSNGIFTCDFYGEFNHQNYDSGTPRTDSKAMIVYLYPKKVN